MAMNTSRTASLMEEADIGGSALARVPVAPPLPLLTARLEAPGLRAEAPAKVEGVRATPAGGLTWPALLDPHLPDDPSYAGSQAQRRTDGQQIWCI